jgi:hypothetical protein
MHVKQCLKVSPWWNFFLLSPKSFIQKVEFCLCGAVFNVHETLLKLPLRLALEMSKPWLLDLMQCTLYACPDFDPWKPWTCMCTSWNGRASKTTIYFVPALLCFSLEETYMCIIHTYFISCSSLCHFCLQEEFNLNVFGANIQHTIFVDRVCHIVIYSPMRRSCICSSFSHFP